MTRYIFGFVLGGLEIIKTFVFGVLAPENWGWYSDFWNILHESHTARLFYFIVSVLSFITVSLIGFHFVKKSFSIQGRRVRATKKVFYPINEFRAEKQKVYILIPVPHDINKNDKFRTINGEGESAKTGEFDFNESEKHALNMLDSRGIAEILAALGDCGIGISEVDIKTFLPGSSDTICADVWKDLERGLALAAISFGSSMIHGLTNGILLNQVAKFEFAENKQFIKTKKDQSCQSLIMDEKFDYAIQGKLKVKPLNKSSGYCFIFGGIGPVGTYMACEHLINNIVETKKQYANAPFLRVLAISRGRELPTNAMKVVAEGPLDHPIGFSEHYFHLWRYYRIKRDSKKVQKNGLRWTGYGKKIVGNNTQVTATLTTPSEHG